LSYFAAKSIHLKKTTVLILVLLLLSCLSGYLMSKPSLIGRIGISLFYHEYRFLRTWWKGALAVFGTLMVLLALQGVAQRKLPLRTSRLLHIGLVLLALGGLYLTYSDFQHTATHRWLKEKFHLGAYLFWIGWLIVSFFYLATGRERRITVTKAPQTTMV